MPRAFPDQRTTAGKKTLLQAYPARAKGGLSVKARLSDLLLHLAKCIQDASMLLCGYLTFYADYRSTVLLEYTLSTHLLKDYFDSFSFGNYK